MKNNTIHKLSWSVKRKVLPQTAGVNEVEVIRFDSINDSFDSEDVTFDTL